MVSRNSAQSLWGDTCLAPSWLPLLNDERFWVSIVCFFMGSLSCWGFRAEMIIVCCCVEIVPGKDCLCIDWVSLVFQITSV